MKTSVPVIAAALALLSQLSPAHGQTPGIGSTDIDLLRYDFARFEVDVWRVVNNVRLSQVDRLEEAYRRFKEFIQDRMAVIYGPEVYLTLERFYEWQILQPQVATVNNLFEAFRNFLAHQLSSQFEELAATDFAETVLQDSKLAVNDTLESIDLIMMKQGMYYKASAVGIFYHKAYVQVQVYQTMFDQMP
jgi:hypothetical protein